MKPLLKKLNRWLRCAHADNRITVEFKPGIPLRGPWLVEDARRDGRALHWWEDSLKDARANVRRLIALPPDKVGGGLSGCPIYPGSILEREVAARLAKLSREGEA